MFLVLLSSSFASAQIDWRGLSVDDGAKRPLAYFPGEAQQITDTVSTPLGEMEFTTYYFRDEGKGSNPKSGNLLYTLTIVAYPDGSFHTDSTARIQAFFDATLDTATEAVAGELRFAEALEAPYTGYIFRIDYGDERDRIVRNRAYLVGDVYYHMQVFSHTGEGGERSRARFFESFSPEAL